MEKDHTCQNQTFPINQYNPYKDRLVEYSYDQAPCPNYKLIDLFLNLTEQKFSREIIHVKMTLQSNGTMS